MSFYSISYFPVQELSKDSERIIHIYFLLVKCKLLMTGNCFIYGAYCLNGFVNSLIVLQDLILIKGGFTKGRVRHINLIRANNVLSHSK